MKTTKFIFSNTLKYFALVSLLAITTCGNKSDIIGFVEDKNLSNQDALTKISDVVWEYYINDNKKVTFAKNANGKITMDVRIKASGMTSLKNMQSFKDITLSMAGKSLWRMLVFGSKRDLDAITLSYSVPVQGGDVIHVFTSRLTMTQLKQVQGWDTLDSYDVGEHDLLDESVRHMPEEVRKVWTMLVDNFGAIRF